MHKLAVCVPTAFAATVTVAVYAVRPAFFPAQYGTATLPRKRLCDILFNSAYLGVHDWFVFPLFGTFLSTRQGFGAGLGSDKINIYQVDKL